MDLEELLTLIRREWPVLYTRGLISHLYCNHVTLSDGSQIHLRVLIQRLKPQDYREDR